MLTPEEEERKAQLLKEIEELEDNARRRYWREENNCEYSFDQIKSVESLREIKEFQAKFFKYAPFMLDDENCVIRIHHFLLSGIFYNPPQTINKSRFEFHSKRFRRSIQTLAEWDIWGNNRMISLASSAHRLSDESDPNNAAYQIYRAILLIRDCFDHDKNLHEVIDIMESWAREVAEDIPDRRNINWNAVAAVAQLRWCWEMITETQAPSRALNPESVFADFLRDAFEFFEIRGDPVSAFKRWVALSEEHEHLR